MSRIAFYIKIAGWLLLPFWVSAQASETTPPLRPFSEQEWQRAKEGIDYSTDRTKPRKKRSEQQKTDAGGSAKESSGWLGSANAAALMRVLAIVIGGVALVLLLRSLLGLRQPRNKKVDYTLSAAELEAIEENLHEANLEDFIRQAVERQEFALAIRLYYLTVLQNLSWQNAIVWQRDKTNRDYLRELRHSEWLETFREITDIFERVWYGNRPVSATEFARLAPKFRAFIDQIQLASTPQLP